MDFPVYPLIFKPVYKNYVWGGARIGSAKLLNINTAPKILREECKK